MRFEEQEAHPVADVAEAVTVVGSGRAVLEVFSRYAPTLLVKKPS